MNKRDFGISVVATVRNCLASHMTNAEYTVNLNGLAG
jgi:hypothetical protein